MPININGNILSSGSIAPGGSVQRPVVLNGSTAALAAPSPGYLYRNGITTDGIYYMNPGGLPTAQFYIDFTTYPGKPLTMVISNRQGSNGFPNLSYNNALNNVNTVGTYDANRNFNVWVGLSYWRYLGNWVLQGCKGNQQSYVAGTQNVTFGNMDVSGKFKFAGWASDYSFRWSNTWTQIAGTGTSGLYAYHALNNYPLSTFDYNSGCASQYGGNPWWYGSCWSGSYFGGGTAGNYVNGPYWESSGSLWYAYGAIYMAYDTATMDS
jgi:hypothetical protein